MFGQDKLTYKNTQKAAEFIVDILGKLRFVDDTKDKKKITSCKNALDLFLDDFAHPGNPNILISEHMKNKMFCNYVGLLIVSNLNDQFKYIDPQYFDLLLDAKVYSRCETDYEGILN